MTNDGDRFVFGRKGSTQSTKSVCYELTASQSKEAYLCRPDFLEGGEANPKINKNTMHVCLRDGSFPDC